MSCPSCAADLPEAARFCPVCGTPVAADPVREVRKTVTLLFTDVTGSTALGEQLDPEAYRAIMGRYFAVARDAVERHGGTVEKFVGDAVLAVFGIPDVREDDALRAVRAAAEMVRGLAELSADLERTVGVRLEVRTGVNTGAVVAGSSRAGGSFATGDAVNTAARLEQAAPPGAVLIGETTLALVRDAVDVAQVEPIVAKGKSQPLVAYRLESVHDTAEGRSRRQDTRLVGRDRETRVLLDAFERTLETGRGHLVTVVGAPGIGKTRLIGDFLAGLGDRAQVITSRCVAYGQGITFWPVVQLLRQALGLSGGESEEVTRHALSELLAGSPDADTVVDLLLALLGKHAEPGGSDQTFWAVRRALEQLAMRRPLVVAVDDLHWAEPTLLELLDRVRQEVRDLPLLLVCQARPELLEQRPSWGGGALNSTTFGLEPFTRQQTAASLSSLLGDRVDEVVASVVTEWAGGNPLFVEEVAGHLVDHGLLTPDSDGWSLTGDLAEAAVPPTVAALLAARLDRLPEQERRLVERLAVVGLEVSLADAVCLAEGGIDAEDVPGALAALVHRDVMARRRSPDGEVWAFRHILVRDAAYESLPKSLRAELHERFAVRVEGAAETVGPEHLAFAGHHLEQSVRHRRELAAHDAALSGLVERAVDVLRRAADHARDREDLAAAAGLLRRALDLPPPTSAERRALLEELAQVHADEEQIDELAVTVDELAAALDDTAGDLDRLEVSLLRDLVDLSRSRPIVPADLSREARRCADLARAAGRQRLLLLALRTQANCDMMRARWTEVADTFAELGTIGRPQDRRWANMFRGASIVYGADPIGLLEDHVVATLEAGTPGPGDHEQVRLLRLVLQCAAGDPACREALSQEEAREEATLSPVFRLTFLSIAALMAGDERGVRYLRTSLQVMLDAGDLSHASTVLPWLGLVLAEREGADVEEIERLVEQGAEVTSPYDVLSVGFVAAGRGVVASLRGRHDEARLLLDEAIRVIDDSDQLWQQADARRWAAAAAARRGDEAEERRLLTDALDGYRRKGLAVWTGRCEGRLAGLR